MNAFSLQLSYGECAYAAMCVPLLPGSKSMSRDQSAPDDPGELIGDRNRGFVMTASGGGIDGPLLQARQLTRCHPSPTDS